MLWTGIVTIPFAIVQALVACLGLLVCLAMAIGLGSLGSDISSLTNVIDNNIPGMNIGGSVNSYFALIMIIILLIGIVPVAISVMLCVGICQNKPAHILVYVFLGGVVTIGRMTMLTKWNFRNFPEDKTVLYIGLYTLYLILLVTHVVKIKQGQKQGAILSVPAAYPVAVSPLMMQATAASPLMQPVVASPMDPPTYDYQNTNRHVVGVNNTEKTYYDDRIC